ncbi:MAG: hypothetical protein V4660_01235 [Pseudomonadota bacterium]
MFEIYNKLDVDTKQILSILFTISLILMLLNGVVQSFILSNKGWSQSINATLIVTSIATFIFFIVAFYISLYGRSNADVFMAILCTFILFIYLNILLIGFNYGINIAVTFFKTGVLLKTEMIFWLCIYVGMPITIIKLNHDHLYKIQYAESKKILMPLRLFKNSALPIYIYEIKFSNSTSKEETATNLAVHGMNEWSGPEDIENVSDREKSFNQNFFSDDLLIPDGTNQISMSWFSFLDHKLYKDIFPIDLSKFEIKTEYNLVVEKPLVDSSLKPPKVGSTALRFKLNGEVDLLTYVDYQNTIVESYANTKSEELTKDQENELKNKYISGYRDLEYYDKNEEQYKTLLEKLYLVETTRFKWNFTIESQIGKLSHVRYDNINDEHISFENKDLPLIKERLLPSLIEYSLRSEDLKHQFSPRVYVNVVKLFDILKPLPADEDINFFIKVDIYNKKMEFYIRSKSLNVIFNDFKLNWDDTDPY